MGSDSSRTKAYLYIDKQNSGYKVDNLFVLSGLEGDGEISFDNSGKENYRISAGTNHYETFQDWFSVYVGAEWEERSTEDYLFRDETNGETINQIGGGVQTTPGYNGVLVYGAGKVQEKSVFSQLEFKSNESTFVLGARYVDNDLSGSRTTPRIAWIYSFSDVHVKFLHAIGFNSPNATQNRLIATDGTLVDNEVMAERNRATDVSVETKGQHLSWKLNAFHSRLIDPIVQLQGVYQNGSEYIRQGVESELYSKMGSHTLFANFSYLVQGNSILEDDISAYFAPKYLANLGANYSINRNWDLSLTTKYLGRRAVKNRGLAAIASCAIAIAKWNTFLELKT